MSLTQELGRFEGVLLDVGCGRMPYKPLLMSDRSRVTKYIGLDIAGSRHTDADNPPDLTWDGITMPIDSGSIDGAIATEVLHQCRRPDVVLAEAARVLKPGGVFFCSVPFLWPIHDCPDDQVRFTPYSLERHLCEAGFHGIRIAASGGWDASLAQMLGLWVRRRPMRRLYRGVLSRIAKPIIRYLAKNDECPDLTLRTEPTVMVTGLFGTAVNGPARAG